MMCAMDLDAVRRLEDAGDVAGLAEVLLHPRFETVGDVKLAGEAAGQALGGLPYKSVHALDLNSLQRLDVNADERTAAAAALGRLGTKEAAQALIDGLKDLVPAVRLAVCGALEAAAVKMKGEKARLPYGLRSDVEWEIKLGKRELEGFKLLERQTELERYFDL